MISVFNSICHAVGYTISDKYIQKFESTIINLFTSIHKSKKCFLVFISVIDLPN